MELIDVKDKKILYHLYCNSRQSYTQLGKKVGLHKDTVADRVKKLQDKGIIYTFSTLIDFSRLGYIVFRYYFSYQFITPEKRKEIIDYFVNNKYSLWICSLEGQYDLSVYMAVKDINDFYHFWDKAFRKYSKYFSKRSFSIFCSVKEFGYSFLLDENVIERKELENMVEIGGKPTVIIDNLDFELLKLLSYDSRMPIIKLSEKLNCSTQTIKNRIRNLKKLGVIISFVIDIDFSKIDYKVYRVDINLNENVKKQPIVNYIIKNPQLYEIYGTIGDAGDIELEIILKNTNQIHKLLESISLIFPNSVKEYKYHSVTERHKYRGIPEI